MIKETVQAVGITHIVTETGSKTLLGNRQFEIGDSVWTHGNFAFGTERNNPAPMIIPFNIEESDYCFVIWQADKFCVYSFDDFKYTEIAASDLSGSSQLVYNDAGTKFTLIDYQPQNCSNIVKLIDVLTSTITTVTLPFTDLSNSTIQELSAYYDGDTLKWCCFVTAQSNNTPSENDVWQEYGVYSAAAIYDYENDTLVNTTDYVANGLNIVRNEIEGIICAEGFVTVTENLSAFYAGEGNTLDITAGCTTTGNITITADNVSHTIAVNPTQHGTVSAICTKIAAENWGSWKASIIGNSLSFSRQATDDVEPVFSVNLGATGVNGAWQQPDYPDGLVMATTYTTSTPQAWLRNGTIIFTVKDLWAKKVYIEQTYDTVYVYARNKMVQNGETTFDNLYRVASGTVQYTDEFIGSERTNIIKKISINSSNQTQNVVNVIQGANSYIYRTQNGTYDLACIGYTANSDTSAGYLTTRTKTFANGYVVTADTSKVTVSNGGWSYDATSIANAINVSAVTLVADAPQNSIILALYGDDTDKLYLINKTTNSIVLATDSYWVVNYNMPLLKTDKEKIKFILQGRQ